VLIGVSTGGPRTLDDILPLLPADFPWPVLVAQHMPPRSPCPFAKRMDRCAQMQVVEAAHPMVRSPDDLHRQGRRRHGDQSATRTKLMVIAETGDQGVPLAPVG
jgi:chemotaxis response regulator CheB